MWVMAAMAIVGMIATASANKARARKQKKARRSALEAIQRNKEAFRDRMRRAQIGDKDNFANRNFEGSAVKDLEDLRSRETMKAYADFADQEKAVNRSRPSSGERFGESLGMISNAGRNVAMAYNAQGSAPEDGKWMSGEIDTSVDYGADVDNTGGSDAGGWIWADQSNQFTPTKRSSYRDAGSYYSYG